MGGGFNPFMGGGFSPYGGGGFNPFMGGGFSPYSMGGFGPSQMEMQQLAMLRQQQQAQPQGSPQYSDQMVRPSEEALSRIRAYQSSDEGKRKIAEAIARMQHPKYNSMTNTIDE
jgi:hypothetical protein